MKKALFFLLFSVMISAQKTQLIQLTQNIKDKDKAAKSLTIIDYRDQKTIGPVSHQGQPFEIQFKENQIEKSIQDWFLSDNKNSGNTDFVVVVENIKAYDEPKEKSVTGKLEIKLSSFVKKGDKYYFVHRISENFSFQPKYDTHIPRLAATKIAMVFSRFINDSYSIPSNDFAMTDDELRNYEEINVKQLKSLNNETLSDGVYVDFKSFANQKPNKAYSVYKNKKGFVTGFINAKELPVGNGTKFYGYVENGIPYRQTQIGFLEMEKDENGFYIISSKNELFPQGISDNVLIGSMIGGVVGGLVVGVIESSQKRDPNAPGMGKVYLDSLTGAYIFD